MAELSRGELISWVNDLTNLNIPKVESLGTGAAHCLVFQSIFGDLAMHKVNFKAIHEYEYVQNFKVLQEAFTKHRIDRTIPVDKLIKLKFQDNLEFLQWMKKFWDSNFDGSNVANSNVNLINSSSLSSTNLERKFSQTSQSSINNQKRRSSSIVSTSSSTSLSSSLSSNVPVVPIHTASNNEKLNPSNNNNYNSNNNNAHNGSSNTNTTQNAMQLAALTKTITELKLSVDEMEKERDFYFNKLRDIEILTQKITEPAINSSLFFKQITEILYTTEEGFEIPQESAENNSGNVGEKDAVMSEVSA